MGPFDSHQLSHFLHSPSLKFLLENGVISPIAVKTNSSILQVMDLLLIVPGSGPTDVEKTDRFCVSTYWWWRWRSKQLLHTVINATGAGKWMDWVWESGLAHCLFYSRGQGGGSNSDLGS